MPTGRTPSPTTEALERRLERAQQRLREAVDAADGDQYDQIAGEIADLQQQIDQPSENLTSRLETHEQPEPTQPATRTSSPPATEKSESPHVPMPPELRAETDRLLTKAREAVARARREKQPPEEIQRLEDEYQQRRTAFNQASRTYYETQSISTDTEEDEHETRSTHKLRERPATRTESSEPPKEAAESSSESDEERTREQPPEDPLVELRREEEAERRPPVQLPPPPTDQLRQEVDARRQRMHEAGEALRQAYPMGVPQRPWKGKLTDAQQRYEDALPRPRLDAPIMTQMQLRKRERELEQRRQQVARMKEQLERQLARPTKRPRKRPTKREEQLVKAQEELERIEATVKEAIEERAMERGLEDRINDLLLQAENARNEAHRIRGGSTNETGTRTWERAAEEAEKEIDELLNQHARQDKDDNEDDETTEHEDQREDWQRLAEGVPAIVTPTPGPTSGSIRVRPRRPMPRRPPLTSIPLNRAQGHGYPYYQIRRELNEYAAAQMQARQIEYEKDEVTRATALIAQAPNHNARLRRLDEVENEVSAGAYEFLRAWMEKLKDLQQEFVDAEQGWELRKALDG